MLTQEISDYFRKIAESIERKRLKEAFEMLTFLLSKLQNWQLKERLAALEDTYKMMLGYLTEGVNDPEREKVFNDLLRSVYRVADAVELLIRTNIDSSYFYDQRRFYLYNTPEPVENLLHTLEDITGKINLLALLEEEENTGDFVSFEQQKEQTIQKLFRSVLLSAPWGSDTCQKWSEVLNNPLMPIALSCLLITAATLSLLETFDEQKALLLFDAAENENEEVKQRALTGIMLFLRRYDRRLRLYPAINNRLQHLAEDERFIRQILHILLQFIFSRETEAITRKITEEIFPEMMKIAPKLTKLNWEDWLGETGIDEPNPEWQELIKEMGVEDKLMEITELQMEGADVMLSSFMHLKNYPFFDEWSNWFVPFSVPSEFLGNKEVTDLAKILDKTSLMCNSDKYSLCLTIPRMPESHRKMTLGQLSMQSEAMQEMLKEEAVNDSKRTNTITRQYIQDLYRFYKVHPRRRDFADIFECKPEFYCVPSITELIGNKENRSVIGEFYFKKNYFEEAVDIYNQLLEESPDDHVLYQKKGYCLQMLGDLKGALEIYLKAELLNSDNPWLIKKLAHCYRLLKQPEEALLYYKKIERLNPDNLSVQLHIGHCHLELKNYDEALKSYFKVEYLDKNKPKAWRPIAWCSFLIGKYGQAMDYFKKIMELSPNAADYLNAGHTQLALGNYKEAIRLYGLSLKSPDNSLEKFIEAFTGDIPDIVQAGVKEQDIPFILDRIRYDL